MAKMTGFVFQDAYLKRLERLSDAELGQLVRALSAYHASGEEADLDGRAGGAFDFIRADIDEIDDRYNSKCEANRRARTGANDDERQRTSSNDNERAQTSTNADKEKDKIKEKEKERDLDAGTTACAREDTPYGQIEVDPVIVELQKNIGAMTVSHYDDLAAFRQDIPDDLVLEAISEAVAHGARTWAYVRSILQGYVKDGVKTVGQARERSERRKREGPPGKRVTAQLYDQTRHTEEELEARVNDL